MYRFILALINLYLFSRYFLKNNWDREHHHLPSPRLALLELSQRDNNNAPSDMFLDFYDRESSTSIPRKLVPKSCLESIPTDESAGICSAELARFSIFSPADSRENDYLHTRQKIWMPKWIKLIQIANEEAHNLLLSFINTQKATQFVEVFQQVVRYRTMMELVKFSADYPRVNCDEQTALAYFDLLQQVKQQGWPQGFAKKLHRIGLLRNQGAANPENHVFMLLGDPQLLAANVQNDKEAVSKMLANLNGLIIDRWNNPRAGGLKISSQAAAQGYKLYGAGEARWDSITIERLPCQEPFAAIANMAFEPAIKQFLEQLAGPSLDEVYEILEQGQARPSLARL